MLSVGHEVLLAVYGSLGKLRRTGLPYASCGRITIEPRLRDMVHLRLNGRDARTAKKCQRVGSCHAALQILAGHIL